MFLDLNASEYTWSFGGFITQASSSQSQQVLINYASLFSMYDELPADPKYGSDSISIIARLAKS